jgi:hypothetical protein
VAGFLLKLLEPDSATQRVRTYRQNMSSNLSAKS